MAVHSLFNVSEGVMKTSAWRRPRKSQLSTSSRLRFSTGRRWPEWGFSTGWCRRSWSFLGWHRPDWGFLLVDAVDCVNVHFTDVFITPQSKNYYFLNQFQTFFSFKVVSLYDINIVFFFLYLTCIWNTTITISVLLWIDRSHW